MEVLGEVHDNTISTRCFIAYSLRKVGKLTEALECHRGLLADLERKWENHHLDSLLTRNDIVDILIDLEKYDEVLQECNVLTPLQKKILGEKHVYTMHSTCARGVVLYYKGDYDTALHILQNLLPKQIEVLGEVHCETISTRNFIAYCLTGKGKLTEALECHRGLLTDLERKLGKHHPESFCTRKDIADILEYLEKYD
ncbi:uncharacterized protein LOC113362946 [Ctenocephalides felis]|uniref:uncharacterized protein LOC113362946 n=1 Tax=Ctenocephalides felis TaxID=7515 RepID=UPI000E6E2779|nr:uncharacterized protein LOC113362946 [Ctenocephalides felis]